MGNCCASGEENGNLPVQSSIKRGSPSKNNKDEVSIIDHCNQNVRVVYETLGDYKEGTWLDDGVVIEYRPEIIEIENGAKY